MNALRFTYGARDFRVALRFISGIIVYNITALDSINIVTVNEMIFITVAACGISNCVLGYLELGCVIAR